MNIFNYLFGKRKVRTISDIKKSMFKERLVQARFEEGVRQIVNNGEYGKPKVKLEDYENI